MWCISSPLATCEHSSLWPLTYVNPSKHDRGFDSGLCRARRTQYEGSGRGHLPNNSSSIFVYTLGLASLLAIQVEDVLSTSTSCTSRRFLLARVVLALFNVEFLGVRHEERVAHVAMQPKCPKCLLAEVATARKANIAVVKHSLPHCHAHHRSGRRYTCGRSSAFADPRQLLDALLAHTIHHLTGSCSEQMLESSRDCCFTAFRSSGRAFALSIYVCESSDDAHYTTGMHQSRPRLLEESWRHQRLRCFE
jgi:hypothetical protein